jgi:cell fate regulator YaaT (PSP1 superfamily)
MVKLRPSRKNYQFICDLQKCKVGQFVVVETSRGIEYGQIVSENPRCCCEKKKTNSFVNKVIRIATEDDSMRFNENREKSHKAFQIFTEKIDKYKLNMKPIDAEYTLDCKKIVFYFSAKERVDFRALVKDLAYFFHVRIELRQIGTRDETKIMGGIGICGKPFCCSTFLNDFRPVLIKTAKDQGIFLSPSKISGNCGRLMCCLKYEEQSYAEFSQITPPICSIVLTKEGEGTVVESNLLTGVLKVQIKKFPKISSVVTVKREDVEVIKRFETPSEDKDLNKELGASVNESICKEIKENLTNIIN